MKRSGAITPTVTLTYPKSKPVQILDVMLKRNSSRITSFFTQASLWFTLFFENNILFCYN